MPKRYLILIGFLCSFSQMILSSSDRKQPRIQIDPHYSGLKDILEKKGYEVVHDSQETSSGDYVLISHHDAHIHEEEPYRAWGLFFKKGEGLEKEAKGNFRGESKRSFLKAAERLLKKVPPPPLEKNSKKKLKKRFNFR